MKLSEKLLTLRKQRGMSQEELAEKLDVSRQAVSRWEVGSAQPDASNLLQLSKLYGVTADYLLHDEYEGDQDIPAVRQTEAHAKCRIRQIIALCAVCVGALGNLVVYILSRCIEVMVPRTIYHDGKQLQEFASNYTDHSYRWFVREYDLEFLTALCWGLMLAGLICMLFSREKVRHWLAAQWEKWRQRKAKPED